MLGLFSCNLGLVSEALIAMSLDWHPHFLSSTFNNLIFVIGGLLFMSKYELQKQNYCHVYIEM